MSIHHLCSHRNALWTLRCHGIRHVRRIQTQNSQEPFKILFFGSDVMSCHVFEELFAARDVWQSVSIGTLPDIKPRRRGDTLHVSPLRLLGESLDIPVHLVPPTKSAFRQWQPPEPFQSTYSPTHVIVTASFGRMIFDPLLKLFHPSRRFNVHPSLLPDFRGAAPIQHAIMRGDAETGVCVIDINERKMGVDTGDIYAQTRIVSQIPAPISDDIAYPELQTVLAREGGRLLASVLRDTLSGVAQKVPQKRDPEAPLAPMINDHHSIVDFLTMSAHEIVRRHRAISHQRPLKTYLPNYKNLQLHSPVVYTAQEASLISDLPLHVLNRVGVAAYCHGASGLLIRCASDTVLRVPEVKEEGRNRISAREWWNGVRPELAVDGNRDQGVAFLPKEKVWDRTGFLRNGDAFEKNQFLERVEARDRAAGL
ncbi:hypothetical protein PLICRDRAFT_111863 [Plicaturopsis crispa FD-325 SS-3]|nr:hypothetical protein PLICRDRAFT_111863 [Plicaturopsis crispa FD-325 SS-3]